MNFTTEQLQSKTDKELKRLRTYYKCNWQALNNQPHVRFKSKQVERELKRRGVR